MKNISTKICVLSMCACLLGSCTKPAPSPAYLPEATEDSFVFYLPDGLRDIGQYNGSSTILPDAYSAEFTPSEDYGELLYFIGSPKVFMPADFEGYGSVYNGYGLCTKDGKVVKMPVYDRIQPTQSGHLVLTPAQVSAKVSEEDWHKPISAMLIPSDGSFLFTEDDVTISDYSKDGSFKTTKYEENAPHPTQSFYDKDGKLIFSTDRYDYIGELKNGLCYANVYNENGESYSCMIDTQGNEVTDRFIRATNFNEQGYAFVKTDRGFGIINTKGEFVVSDIYDSMRLVFTGAKTMFCALKDGRCYAFDCDGSLIKEFDTDWFVNLYGDGDKMYYSLTGSGINQVNYYRLKDDGKIVCSHCKKAANNIIGLNKADTQNLYFITPPHENNKSCVFGYDGEKCAETEGYMWGENVYDGKLLYNANADDPSKSMGILYDLENNKEICRFENSSYVFMSDDGKYIIAHNNDDSMSLYGFDDGELIIENAEVIATYSLNGKSYVSVCTKNYTRLYDGDLNIIMSYANDYAF